MQLLWGQGLWRSRGSQVPRDQAKQHASVRHVQPRSGMLDTKAEIEGLSSQPIARDHSMKEPKILVDTFLPQPGHLLWVLDKVWLRYLRVCVQVALLWDTLTCQREFLGSFLLN